MSTLLAFLATAFVGIIGSLAGNYFTEKYKLKKKLPWLTLKRAVVGMLVLGLVTGLVNYAADKAGEDSPPAPSTAPTGSPPSTAPSRTGGAEVRPPSQWAAEIQSTCAGMEKAFTADLAAMREVDKMAGGPYDPKRLAAQGRVLHTLYDHYARLATKIHDVPPPSYSADSATGWIGLFDERGTVLRDAAEKIDSKYRATQVTAAVAMYGFSTRTDKLTSLGEQMGITSCP